MQYASMFKRRPFLVTPWAIWINPRLKLRCRYIKFWLDMGTDDRGRTIVKIVDEIDRDYWVRMSPRQMVICRMYKR